MLVDDPTGASERLHIVRRWESHLNPRIIAQNGNVKALQFCRPAVKALEIFNIWLMNSNED